MHESTCRTLGILGKQLDQQRSVDWARRERIDTNARTSELHAELAAHREHAALGRGVGDLRGGRGHGGNERSRVDDRALALLEHVGQHLLAAQVHTGEVDLLHATPGIDAGLEDRVIVGR